MILLNKGNYYGTEKTAIRWAGIGLSEYEYTSESTDWHYHENPYFMYLLQGNLLDSNKVRHSHCPAGSLLFHNWDEVHRNIRKSPTARGFHIEFDRNWFGLRGLNQAIWEGSRLLEDPHLHLIVAGIYYEFCVNDLFTGVALEALVAQLCLEVDAREFSIREKEPVWVARLKELLREEQMDISLSSLGQQLGVHPAHLSRAIPKYLHTTLGDYMRRERIKRALENINSPNLSLTQIGAICGFSDQSHFIRTFRMYLGVTPGDYRKRLPKG